MLPGTGGAPGTPGILPSALATPGGMLAIPPNIRFPERCLDLVADSLPRPVEFQVGWCQRLVSDPQKPALLRPGIPSPGNLGSPKPGLSPVPFSPY